MNKITDFTCDGKCSSCGQCCGDILHLSQKEIERIDYYLKNKSIKETPRIILVDYDNTCPFRDNKNKLCKIYPVRPDICRVFQCNKNPKEVARNRELNNAGKYPRSMRNLFFNDDKGAVWINNITGMKIFDREDKPIE